MRLSVSISTIFSLFVSLSTICALIPSWRFLIVLVFPICSIQNCPDLVIKNNWSGIQNSPGRFTTAVLFYQLARFDGMGLKIEGASILCIVAVLAKTCLEKFIPKVRRTSYNLLPVKTLVRHISQTIRRIEKHFF